jgi:hypothetical protein
MYRICHKTHLYTITGMDANPCECGKEAVIEALRARIKELEAAIAILRHSEAEDDASTDEEAPRVEEVQSKPKGGHQHKFSTRPLEPEDYQEAFKILLSLGAVYEGAMWFPVIWIARCIGRQNDASNLLSIFWKILNRKKRQWPYVRLAAIGKGSGQPMLYVSLPDLHAVIERCNDRQGTLRLVLDRLVGHIVDSKRCEFFTLTTTKGRKIVTRYREPEGVQPDVVPPHEVPLRGKKRQAAAMDN